MCRITGTVNHPIEVATAMVNAQVKGGPDLFRVQKYGNVVLGHNLLLIIGQRPQPVADGRYSMVFNGAIYNYKELYPYATSDTDVILDHFRMKGLKAVDDFIGMFAIGLYDSVEQTIHLIVDRFGEKPIYYYHEGDTFAFASNPAALYPLKRHWQLDREALQSYWLLGSVMGENGLFKGIKKVCASQMVTYDIRANTVKTERYYEPKFHEDTRDIEEIGVDAIQKVGVSDVPVHIFLSGGIDSTLVASQFVKGNAVHLNSPERHHAQFVANKFDINLKIVESVDIDTEACLRDYVTNSGEPTMAGLIPYITAREVSKFGRVAITANGADELFFGYDRTHDDVSVKQYQHTFRDLPYPEQWPFYRLFNNDTNGRMFELGGYVQYDLNKTLDSASMCHALEVRSPFLDYRLVEKALSIPEAIHRKKGNKTILKEMLRKMGFHNDFLNRQKLGFSLHDKPKDIEQLKAKAWKFVKENGYLQCNDQLTPRDRQYLEMSALGFYFWYDVWKEKISKSESYHYDSKRDTLSTR